MRAWPPTWRIPTWQPGHPGLSSRTSSSLGASWTKFRETAPGHIRAFDVRTGELVWIFHTVPQPGEFGYETWPTDSWYRNGGANSWAGLALDMERGIVFAPTGSASFDFYGGDRVGQNLFANWNELQDRKPAYALVSNVDLVLIRYDDDISVLYGRCLHRGALLADGSIEGPDLICGVHQ